MEDIKKLSNALTESVPPRARAVIIGIALILVVIVLFLSLFSAPIVTLLLIPAAIILILWLIYNKPKD